MSKVKLKTLKELVDEFGERLKICPDFHLWIDEIPHTDVDPKGKAIDAFYLPYLTKNTKQRESDLNKADLELFPDWAIKKPEKKRLFAYLDKEDDEVRFFVNHQEKIRHDYGAEWQCAPEFDLYFDEEGE